MTKRISLGGRTSEPIQQLQRLHALVEKTAADAGLDRRLILLIYIRSSMLNGCAFCLDMHTRDARGLGETERRIYLLGAWRETDLYSEQERAALALTDAMTRLSETQDVPDEVYERAVSVFTEDQYHAVAWTITVINAFNRLGVASRWKLPPQRLAGLQDEEQEAQESWLSRDDVGEQIASIGRGRWLADESTLLSGWRSRNSRACRRPRGA
jgi:AhpD family alkylhydroperoxidase